MAKTFLRYDKMVEDALRGVLREALQACGDGIPGDHHFYISFRTHHPGVDIPDYIRARFPDEMTIVLQHQYWGLEVTPEWFEVTLSFNRVNERLHIPFEAVIAFTDPSVKFGLQFQAGGQDEDAEMATEEQPSAALPGEEAEGATESVSEAGAQVIALDAFRKK